MSFWVETFYRKELENIPVFCTSDTCDELTFSVLGHSNYWIKILTEYRICLKMILNIEFICNTYPGFQVLSWTRYSILLILWQSDDLENITVVQASKEKVIIIC